MTQPSITAAELGWIYINLLSSAERFYAASGSKQSLSHNQSPLPAFISRAHKHRLSEAKPPLAAQPASIENNQ